jgi:shikimate kinase
MPGTNTEIILIGPVRSGKSTLGRLLAEKLGLPQVSLDDLRWKYYREIGYDEVLAQTFRQRGGFLAMVLYWNLFDAYAIERLLDEHRTCVFDFGAGAGTTESQESFIRVQHALAPYPNVFLILPSPDIEEALHILRQRDLQPPADLNFDFNRHFLERGGYHCLAKHTVFTRGRTPEETRDDILDLIEKGASQIASKR